MACRRSHFSVHSAFTLIEVLAAIAVIAIITGIVASGIRSVQQRSLAARCQADLAILAGALDAYRHYYGDYPRLGEFAHAAVTPIAQTETATETAEAKLFNCLIGRFGPADFLRPDAAGPNFLKGTALLSGTALSGGFIPSHDESSPATEQPTALLDPYGNRYLYYYKSRTTPSAWARDGYLLISAGADHSLIPPDVATGKYSTMPEATDVNADNVVATP